MKKKIKVFAIFFLAAFFVFRLTVFMVLTRYVKSHKSILIETLSDKFGRQISARAIKVKPLGGIHVYDLEVHSLDEDDFLEYFKASSFTTHLNFLNLVRGKKSYLGTFRKVSFHGASLKLKRFKQPLINIKGGLLGNNGDFYVNRLKFPLGKTEFICEGWIRDFIQNPTIDLNMEVKNFSAGDLRAVLPKLEGAKLDWRGKLSGRLFGPPGEIKILGEVVLNDICWQKVQVGQIKSNFYFCREFINFSPFQAKTLEGEISGKIKVTELFSRPALAAEVKMKAIQLSEGKYSGKLSFIGDLFAPAVLGKIKFTSEGKDISLENFKCQLGFSPDAVYCKEGEVFLPEAGRILWAAKIEDKLAYTFSYYLPPLKSKKISFFIEDWPNFPGVFKLDGKISGLIGSSKVNYEGNLSWGNGFEKVKNANWTIKKDKDRLKIENISVSFSKILKCSLQGEKKRDELKFVVLLERKGTSDSICLTLAGKVPASGTGFAGKISAEPIVIQEKTYPALAGSIKKDSKKLTIENLRWLEAYFGEAEINFSPLSFRGNLRFDEADISPILAFSPSFSEKENYGRVSGKIEWKGNWPEIGLKGTVQLNDSKISGKNIKYAKFQFEGVLPYFSLKESPLFLDNTAFICQGEIDLSRQGKGMFKNVDCVLDENQMVWKGWKINPKAEEKSLSLTKELSGGFSVRLQTPTVDELGEDLAKQPGPQMELECAIKGKKKLKLRIDGNDDFIGIQHEVKF